MAIFNFAFLWNSEKPPLALLITEIYGFIQKSLLDFIECSLAKEICH